jgi:hypothetical protein
MKSYRMVVGVALAVLLSSCGPVKPTTTPPTVTSAVLPSATLTAVAHATATFTSIPPTATTLPTTTATLAATATATLQPTMTPTSPAFLLTQNFPPIPKGMGALIVLNHYQQDELDLDIGGVVYKIPGAGRMVIFLSPGRHTFSASVAGHAGRSGATEIVENYYVPQDYGQ